MLTIARKGLQPDALRGETVIVTGAGGGIGYEAARSLLWLGANVVVAEINAPAGQRAAERLAAEFDAARVSFVHTDVGDEASVRALRDAALGRFGKVDAVINNATIAAIGSVLEVPIARWDDSYRVNLRGPVLLAQAFLPGMIERRHGAFLCVSSTGTAFLGGYETFKAAQVHLANTLDAELEGSGVSAFAIGPGLVPTATATAAIDRLGPLLGMTADEFFAQNKQMVLSAEEAGAGFAAAVVLAERYRGMEVSSLQVLKDLEGGPVAPEDAQAPAAPVATPRPDAVALSEAVWRTLKEQADGWKRRNVFERQWVIRDFKKNAGMSVEDWLQQLARLTASLKAGTAPAALPLSRLAGYYGHLADLAKGYEKDKARLEEQLGYLERWRDEVEQLARAVGEKEGSQE